MDQLMLAAQRNIITYKRSSKRVTNEKNDKETRYYFEIFNSSIFASDLMINSVKKKKNECFN